MVVFNFNVDNEQKAAICVAADHGIARFAPRTGIDDAKKRIEKRFRSSFKRNAIMLSDVATRFFFIPAKSESAEFELNIHRQTMSQRIVIVNTFRSLGNVSDEVILTRIAGGSDGCYGRQDRYRRACGDR